MDTLQQQSMRADPLHRVDELCGSSHATQDLRRGIAKFAAEQAKHFLRMHDPAWVDRAITSPDWAREQLQLCQRAVQRGIETMETQIAPFCEELAKMESKQTGISLDRVTVKMAKQWTSLKEVGSMSISGYIGLTERNQNMSPSLSAIQPLVEFKKDDKSIEIGFTR
ncbi:MAG: hypothetical protein OXG94_10790 [Bacteroidetes bacterium]|nr:hypothetical protein [Bacteroidota bacterium]